MNVLKIRVCVCVCGGRQDDLLFLSQPCDSDEQEEANNAVKWHLLLKVSQEAHDLKSIYSILLNVG